jgi:very-short-patch-repair endonuclease
MKDNNYPIFVALLKQQGLPDPEAEYKFLKNRKFKFDYAYPEKKIAIEIEGGLWIKGRHNRASGYIKDMEKYNLAALNGWRILRYTPQQTTSEKTIKQIQEILSQ